MSSAPAFVIATSPTHHDLVTPSVLVSSSLPPVSPTTITVVTPADVSSGKCELLGPFAILVQGALGALALLSLVFKRWREQPQRPLQIWFFDVSKQVFGSVLVHAANIFMSMLTSGRFSMDLGPGRVGQRRAGEGEGHLPNPCSWYLLNLAVDTTLGIPILVILLHLITAVAARTPLGRPRESIHSGYYGTPPNPWWWLKQSVLYFCGLMSMKLCVLVLFLALPWLSALGDWALGWTDDNEELQIVFAMMLFPLIMNAMQYYIIDSFIKEPTYCPDAGAAASSLAMRGQHQPPAMRDPDEGNDNSEVYGEDSGDENGALMAAHKVQRAGER